MRLCVISNGFQEDYMLHYLNSLVGRVERIDFIGSQIYDRTRIDPSINFYDLKGGGIMDLSAVAKIKRVLYYYSHLILFFIRKPRKGIVHLQWLRFKYLDGIFLPLYYKMLGYKLVYTVHDIVPHDKDTRWNRFIFKTIYKLNWKLIVHTEFLRKRLIDEFRIDGNKIRVIRHGVYEVSEKDLAITRSNARTALKVPDDDFVILFFGFLQRYKGLDLLLEAFNRINTERNIRLIVAGRANDIYVSEIQELQEKYNQDNIQFIIRRIEDDELPNLFQSADITALPYREASQSGVLFMSYAYGVPVIVSDIGGFPYDVRNGKTGIIFRCNDSADLQVKLESYIGQTDYKSMFNRDQIRKFARENYSWAKSGKEFVDFLNE